MFSMAIRQFLAVARDDLRDRVEGGPLESLALRTLDLLTPPSRGTLGERRDLALMRSVCARVLGESSNAIDVGANVGRVLRMMVACAPRGTHHAFEPVPRLARRLQRRFPQVRVHGIALAERGGEACFYQQIRNHPQSSLNAPAGVSDDLLPISVPVARLDDMIDPRLAVDLIKIDVEGAEYRVLQGAAATIDRCRPHIIFEYGDAAMRTCGVTPAMLAGLLMNRHRLSLYTLAGFLASEPIPDAEALARLRAAGEVWNFVAAPTR